MKEKGDKKSMPITQKGNGEKDNLQGYPLYHASEDIYSKYQKEEKINPEDISQVKEPVEKDKEGKSNEKDFVDDFSGSDLDIPGSELDDEDEIIGSEDEENNYYSIGGDEHNDLDEYKGE